MKEGFYLSPDGLHIIEIANVRTSQAMDSWTIDFNGHYVECGGLCFWLEILIIGWEYLE